MRKIVVTTFVSLDGVMQAPGGKGEDPSGGFDQEGWLFNSWDDDTEKEMTAFMGKPFDLLLGRKTYDIFSAFWPHAGEALFAGPINAATKYVVSTTLSSAGWGPSVLIGDNVVERIAQLKQEDGPELQVHGSSNLIQTLIANNLIDRFHVLTAPLVLGKGKRLFGEGTFPAGFRLAGSKATPSGVIIANYELAGEIALGSFA